LTRKNILVPKRKRLLVAVVAILVTSSAAVAFAAPGDLDPSFGTGGKVVTDFGYNETAWASAPESFVPFAGKPRVTDVVVDGQLESPTAEDFALARYFSDGGLDPDFGAAGKVVTDFYGRRDQSVAVAVQRDGEIVAAGTSTDDVGPAGKDFALARYQTNGSLDASFGTGGRVVTDLGGGTDDAEAMAIQRDGKIVVAGRSDAVGLPLEIVVVRYLSNGNLDRSFGADGSVFTPFPGLDGGLGGGDVGAVAIQRDGKILVGGLTSSAYGGNFMIARFLHNGRPDPSFGTGGKVVTDFGKNSHSAILALAVRRDASIVAAGDSNVAGTNDFALAFYRPNGTLDPSIGTVVTDFGGDDGAQGMALEGDKIVVSGISAASPTDAEFALARYTASGDLDPTFGTGGKVETSFGAGTSAGDARVSVTLLNEKIIAAGSIVGTPGTGDFALGAYQR
jgi:uncharacterized delta-60 repeat protein